MVGASFITKSIFQFVKENFKPLNEKRFLTIDELYRDQFVPLRKHEIS
jgi:hypothetical protein